MARGKSAEVGAQERQTRTGLHYLAYVGRIHIGSHAREKKSREEGVGAFKMASRP